jgi:hypothetical protein
MYLALLLLGFISLVLYSQQRHLKHQMTLLARETAIANARQPASASSASIEKGGDSAIAP